MKKLFFGVDLVLILALMLFLSVLFYNNYTVLSPSDILTSEGIEIEDIEVNKITIWTMSSESEVIEITDEEKINSIFEDVLRIKAKRDIFFEIKMRAFGSARRHRADYTIGEAIVLNGICNKSGMNVKMLILQGTYIDLEIYSRETSKNKTYSLYKINGAYTYRK